MKVVLFARQKGRDIDLNQIAFFDPCSSTKIMVCHLNRVRTLLRAHAHARAREKSLKNFRLVPLRRRYASNGVARSPLSCRSCRRRSWSGWGGIEQRDDIVDLADRGWLEKPTSEARTGSEADQNPTIGAEHNEAMGHRMTHSQGSNSVARLRRR